MRLVNVNGKANSVKQPLLLLLILLVEEFLLGSIKFHDLITQQAKKASKQASKQTSK
jgi:glycerol-3-phosphate acyltransferase PlsY